MQGWFTDTVENNIVSQQVAKVLKKDKGKLVKKSKKADKMDAFNYNAEDSSDDKESNKAKESNDNLEMESFKAWMALALANQNKLEKTHYKYYDLHVRDCLHNQKLVNTNKLYKSETTYKNVEQCINEAWEKEAELHSLRKSLALEPRRKKCRIADKFVPILFGRICTRDKGKPKPKTIKKN